MAALSHLSFIPNLPPTKVKTFNLKVTSCLSLKQSNDPALASHNDAVSSDTLRVVFAAGGTGGHIYPAVAIADELKSTNPNAHILFLGIPRSMESKAVPNAGYDFAALPAAKLRRPVLSLGNIFLPYYLVKSVIWSYFKLREFDPHVVIGTGGYVSFPVGIAAALRGVKLVIQEQNAVPGIANWLLSFLAEVVFVAFNSTIDCFPSGKKCVVCGNPVRLSLRKNVSKAAARGRFFPNAGEIGEEVKVVLVLGGSLGANAVNIALLNLYYQMLLEKEDLFIIWQTGVEAYNEMESLVKNHPRLLLKPFMHKMDLAFAAADLIVSRAGAMTCYELLATGKPSILIPSPDAAEGHQFRNATLMADLAGARVITEDELDSTTLGNAIEEILGDESIMADMSERALKAANFNASEKIAQHVLSLVSSSRPKK
ncbi:uncharacterized protein LOC126794860 [Argentina anserina]|uniref:uncharacterized protein LOC126794860 n=1 Tax=Argentina anserina TaxID=57926 RepID=UPI002176959D|nr:uncharacterized protein LOC126794860 [Potentilla anserina]XP_050377609.1 uncharacterized protein LOC126794860 [Potentilla anserina]